MKWRSFARASDAFLASLEHGREPETIRSARVRLDMWKPHLSDNPREITPEAVLKASEAMRATLAPSTVKRAHRTLARLLEWMRHPQTSEIDSIRLRSPLPPIRTFNDCEMKTVLDWAFTRHEARWKNRMGSFILVLATTGMRPAEACALPLSSLDQETHTFHLMKTKTGRSRFAPTLPIVTRHLIAYHRTLSLSFSPLESPWIFPALQAPMNHISASAMRTKMARVSQEVGFHVNAKTFRSTLVRRVIEAGGSYEDAASVVGHSDIGVTQRHYHRISLSDATTAAHQRAISSLFSGGIE